MNSGGLQEHEAPTIEIRALTRRFGPVTAVDHLTLTIRAGSCSAWSVPTAPERPRPSGCCGILAPTEGDALVAGRSVRAQPEAVKNRIAYMSQRFGLYGDLTVLENLLFYADLFEVSRQERAARIERSSGSATSPRSRIGLPTSCRADETEAGLGLRPDPHAPDPPAGRATNGVDPVSRRDFWRILYEMLKEGVTILVTTAYLDEAERCNRVGLMHQGRLLALDSPVRSRA